jgi:hypothetical protein
LFAQQNGRLIYFEATYTDFFSNTPAKTPRYDYNQIMYRLALDDPRLFLPVPVYRARSNDGLTSYLLREGIHPPNEWQNIQEISFFAMPPDRQRGGLIPVFAISGERGMVLTLSPPAGTTNAQPLFYSLPAQEAEPIPTLTGTWNCTASDSDGAEFPFILELKIEGGTVRGRVDHDKIAGGTYGDDRVAFQIKLGKELYRVVGRLQDGKLIGDWTEVNTGKNGTWVGTMDESDVAWKKSPDIVPLYEYRQADGSRIYATETHLGDRQMQRSAEPICRVWRNPASLLILDREAKPVPE